MVPLERTLTWNDGVIMWERQSAATVKQTCLKDVSISVSG